MPPAAAVLHRPQDGGGDSGNEPGGRIAAGRECGGGHGRVAREVLWRW